MKWNSALLALSAATAIATPAVAGDATAFIEDAKPYVDARYRYEFVDQKGLLHNANASTLRVRAGVRSGVVAGFSMVAEGEAIVTVGSENFNDTINGKVTYPVVADPEDVVLNQLAARWNGIKEIDVIGGRQTINLGNQRFIGSVGWRQNDQTFDAGMVTVSAVPGLKATYAYAWRVNRVFGPDSPVGIWRDNNIHLLHAEYDAKALGVLTAYGYLLDIPDAPGSSSKTFGARLAGKAQLANAVTALYALEFAHQTEHGDNPANFGLDYFLIEPGLAWKSLTLKAGYERLEGNGSVAFQTPLATLHAFNGWADKFLTTPANGLEDIYVDLTYKHAGNDFLAGTTFKVVYHDFSSTENSVDYGTEWNALISRGFGPHVTVTAKLADYNADGFATDTTKVMLMTEVKF